MILLFGIGIIATGIAAVCGGLVLLSGLSSSIAAVVFCVSWMISFFGIAFAHGGSRRLSNEMQEYRQMTEPSGPYRGDPLDDLTGDPTHPQARSCDHSKARFEQMAEDGEISRANYYNRLVCNAGGGMHREHDPIEGTIHNRMLGK